MNRNFFFDVKVLAIISIAVIASFSSAILLLNSEVEMAAYEGIPKAAFIDQLHDELPNQYLQQKATEVFETAGYEVDIFTTKDITVDFYKKLPQMNYEFIVIRSHGIADETTGDAIIFTGEKYNTDTYIQEQLFGQVKRATSLLERSFVATDIDSSKWEIVNDTYSVLKSPATFDDRTDSEYFAISHKLVDDLMEGQFSDTTFILAGCSTMQTTTMAKSLISRGASDVVGWDNTISNYHNDWLTLGVLNQTLSNNMEIKDVVENFMENYVQDQDYPATFRHYSEKNI